MTTTSQSPDQYPLTEGPMTAGQGEALPETLVNVEDLTLAELLGRLFRAPEVTWAALIKVARTPPRTEEAEQPLLLPISAAPSLALPARSIASADVNREARQREVVQTGLQVSAFLIALYGNSILAAERVEKFGLDVGAPFLILGFLIWLAAEVYGSWPAITTWFKKRSSQPLAPEQVEPEPVLDEPSVPEWQPFDGAPSRGLWTRIVLAGAGLVFSLLTAAWTSGNVFRLEGVLAWFLSIGLWVLALSPNHWSPGTAWTLLRQIRIQRTWAFWILLMIILAGAFFRLHDLSTLPLEMTDDHVEKLLDAQRVLDGNPQVFFPNNGGREPLQMYLMALLSRTPGLGMNFTTLKLLTALEGILTIPVMFWLGREIVGRDNPKLGNLVGLVLAALIAVSYWHVTLSRLGLRIVLTPLITGLLLIFLARAMRENRRGDFILAGLVLGCGLYMYQAVRMLPVVVVVGVVLAILFKARTLRMRRQYVVNLTILVIISVAVFVPLLNFSFQYPQYFWMRTSGRLFGDEVIQDKNENGELIERKPTFAEQVTAFQKNFPVLASNIRNALLMYNWKGDVAWISSAPNRPAMDNYTGALLIVGLAAWLARMVRRRDVVDWLLPIMLFIMIFPSALSIALPIENPSATRMSGTLPEAYLFAALPLALLVASVLRLIPNRMGMLFGTGATAFVTLAAFSLNTTMYFGEYRRFYIDSCPAPYTEVGRTLRGFAESGGSLGNAFLLAYPYWWGHRAIGIEAGVMDWPNGITDPDGDPNPQLPVDTVPRFLYDAAQRTDHYRFDPEKDILFFYAPQDEASQTALAALFPTGYWQLVTTYKPNGDYRMFRVPKLGTDGFVEFVLKHGVVSG